MRTSQILLMLCLTPVSLPAQLVMVSWPVESGSRVRIQTPVFNKARVGTVVATQGDTVQFRASPDATANPIAVRDISHLDVSQGSHTRRMRGLLVGFAAGALLGGGLGAATYRRSNGFDFGRDGTAAFLAGAGGIVGGVMGLAAGSIRTETWVPVALPNR